MLLALGAIALVALGFLITYLVLHRHHHDAQTTNLPPTTAPLTTTTLATGGVTVPDVRTMRASQAESVLQALGLQTRTTPVGPQPGQAPGSVISESPQQGAKVAKGSQVLLIIARGTSAGGATTAASTTTQQTTTAQSTTPASTTVPDVSGQGEAAAATELGKAGLLASLAFVPSRDELGTVEGQGKPAGTTAQYHDHVQINVSTGPGQKPQELVPNVIGKTLEDGLTAINGAHLRLIYLKYPVTSKAQAGKIVQQTPLGGAHAPQNAQVIVYLASYQAG
jgi:beta-lactam-binding protein with PASTA domain